MKYVLATIAFISFQTLYAQSSTASKNVFDLKGSIPDGKTRQIVLSYTDEAGNYRHDTSIVVNGRFSIHGKIKGTTGAYIKGNTLSRSVDDPNFADIYLEPGNLSIVLRTDHFKKAKMTGSKTQLENDAFAIKTGAIRNSHDSVYRLSGKNRSVIASEEDVEAKAHAEKMQALLNAQLENQLAMLKTMQLAFIKENPGSCLSPELLFALNDYVDFDTMKLLYSRFTIPVKESRMGFNLSTLINKKDNSTVGNKAPDFHIKDVNGKAIVLSEFENKKIVLLEFWASWCIPCRAGFPFLKDLYQQYANRGLEIIAVSRDTKKEDWLKAMVADSIDNWRNCSVFEEYTLNENGIFNFNEIENKYYIPAIPITILIDKKGMIAGYFRGKSEENDSQMMALLAALIPN